jgi:hypothetical protein
MELPSAGPCCSSWMAWHSAGGWACVKTAFLTTQARHVTCILSTFYENIADRSSRFPLHVHTILYHLPVWQIFNSNHFLLHPSTCLFSLLLRNESTVPSRRPSYLHSVPGRPTLAAHLAAINLHASAALPRNHLAAIDRSDLSATSCVVLPAAPFRRPVLFSTLPPSSPPGPSGPTLSSTNTTLAGVAQSVERVALITAKRSTSRSWVRAPPSAIPISKLIRAAVLFA